MLQWFGSSIFCEGTQRETFSQMPCCLRSDFSSALVIWLNLPTTAKLLGAAWFAVGILYDGIKTRGFRYAPVMASFKEF